MAENKRRRLNATSAREMLGRFAQSNLSVQGFCEREVCTNAVKYGALSTSAGKVEVSWRVTNSVQARRLLFKWVESGGPPVKAPTLRGFGSQLIERVVAHELDAQVQREFPAEGALHNRVSADREDRLFSEASRQEIAVPDPELKGLRVLLVEDQMIVALHIEDILQTAGCKVLGPIGTLQSAITMAHEEPIDAAILDIRRTAVARHSIHPGDRL